MSLVVARRKNSEVLAIGQGNSDRCNANGCPCRGTISTGGPAVCVYHHSAHPEIWSRATETLIEREDIRLAIDEVLQCGDAEWFTGRWAMMDRFFSHEEELKPTESERNHRRWYEYRLKNHLMYLSGVIGKRPLPRKALEQIAKRGNIGEFVSI